MGQGDPESIKKNIIANSWYSAQDSVFAQVVLSLQNRACDKLNWVSESNSMKTLLNRTEVNSPEMESVTQQKVPIIDPPMDL